MGFDFDRSDATKTVPADESSMNSGESSVNAAGDAGQWAFDRALSRNLVAERFAIDAYRTIAAHSENYDKATLRLVKVALAVEEEHVQILSAIIHNLRSLPGAPAA
jgi:rubrerythrin